MEMADLRVFTEPQQGATYDDLLAVAQHAEQLGYGGFFRSDHYLQTIGSNDSGPGPTDAWTTLAGLARDTSTIRLGALVTPATFRIPGPLAISVAGVDHMSDGRLEFGFGAGWYAEEHSAYGIPFPGVGHRFDNFEEQLAIIHGLWNTPEGETFSYQGKLWQVEDSPALPKPYQQGGPPIIIGGLGPRRTPRLAAQYAAEFNMPFVNMSTFVEQRERVVVACEKIGRDPKTMTWSMSLVMCCAATEAEFVKRAQRINRNPVELRNSAAAGTFPEVVEKLQEWADVGVDRVYLQMLDLSDLHQLTEVAISVGPHLPS